MTSLSHFPEGTTVHEQTLRNGLRMRWYERGEGLTLLGRHGFPELAVSWRNQLERLSHQFRVLAPDMRG